MAVMNATERARCLAQYMRERATSSGLVKADLVAAVAAVDQWIEDNTTSFNAALPVPFRTTATAAEKALLFTYVLRRRNGNLHAEEDG